MAHRKTLPVLLQSIKSYDAVSGHHVRNMSMLPNLKVDDPRHKDVCITKDNVLGDQKVAKKQAGTSKSTTTKEFKIYRWNPDNGGKPYLKSYFVDISKCGPMVCFEENVTSFDYESLKVRIPDYQTLWCGFMSKSFDVNIAGVGCAW